MKFTDQLQNQRNQVGSATDTIAILSIYLKERKVYITIRHFALEKLEKLYSKSNLTNSRLLNSTLFRLSWTVYNMLDKGLMLKTSVSVRTPKIVRCPC